MTSQVSLFQKVKKIYTRFRIALMAFTLGLAGVYMSEQAPFLSGEVHVELPTAASADVLPVFIDNSLVLTRERNCGKDPADAHARLECTNERLFGTRDMSLYARYEITSRSSESDMETGESAEDRIQRTLIWRHWKEKTRAHVVVHHIGSHWYYTDHYLIEPDNTGSWRLTSIDEHHQWLFVDGERTKVSVVDPHHRAYEKARWKTATEDEGPYHVDPGTRYLEFESPTRGTIIF